MKTEKFVILDFESKKTRKNRKTKKEIQEEEKKIIEKEWWKKMLDEFGIEKYDERYTRVYKAYNFIRYLLRNNYKINSYTTKWQYIGKSSRRFFWRKEPDYNMGEVVGVDGTGKYCHQEMILLVNAEKTEKPKKIKKRNGFIL